MKMIIMIIIVFVFLPLLVAYLSREGLLSFVVALTTQLARIPFRLFEDTQKTIKAIVAQ